ncbi:phage virion morphogenesis protein [Helicobacter bilis]|uniref:Phage virion morphogenesis protein n=2 Tax=Helicobacter bilis TaxID=37372 RepID=A0A6D2C208_9HELI|nr:phage virion morphogenesis protein [Helicobacter bilis]EMZ36568.1 phage virion morphogenesis protein [Helicobacter bilis WiWa]TLE02349.1 phage virion morphogenesis protein [Helicobacter bilis]TLE02960.1 phage virion morphogenesis protein [Helicobacter bilis]
MKQNISLQQLINELDFTIKQCKNISPILHEVGNLAKNEAELSFEKETSPFGDKWTPLSKQTLKHKKGSKILTESSMLQSSINSRTKMQKSKGGAKGSASGIVSIGTNLEYAPLHQFGGKAGKNLKANIPARPFLPFKDNDIPNDLKEDIKETILNHFKFGK